MKLLISIFFILWSLSFSQDNTYISSDYIGEKFPEVKKAEEIIKSKVNQWKKELENYQIKIENLELDIEQNHLLWTEKVLKDLNDELLLIKEEKATFAASCFKSGGEYDKLVKEVWEPIEKKIFDKSNNTLDKLKRGK